MNKRHYCIACAIFALNAFLCWPLFRIHYLDEFQSNEGVFIAMGRFIAQQWPHVSWIPWFNAGTPIESAYLPLVPAATAALSALTPYDPARAFHIIAAFAYALGPALLFLFARETSGLTGPSVAAALAWSLTSPTLLLNAYRLDDGAWLGLHRLRTIVFYGETPHNVALSLLPLAWLLLARWWRKPDHPLRFALLVVVVAAILLSNAFGVAVVTLSVLLLWLAVGPRNWAGFASTLAMLLISYLLTCAVLRPSLVLQMVASSRTLGGDYRATWRLLVLPVVLSVLWLFLRRVACPVLRFAGLLAACFGVIAIPDAVSGFAIAPLAQRYALEAELGFCLLAAFAFRRMWEHLPRRVLVPALAALGVLLTAADYRFARRIIREADITNSAVYKESAWIKEHFPGRRVFASGDTGFWLDVFTDNPQIAGGHEATANWVERVATYTIYSGQNAGMQDGPISVLWLKAFGCAAITVPGPASRDYFHPVAHPEKFSRLLPLAWQDGEDYIYAVPLRSDSLAHVIPAAAIVSVQPKNGLDVTQVRRYVDALDDSSLPVPVLRWDNPEQGTLRVAMPPGGVVSIQISYDPGWRAWVAGTPVALRSDGLGMVVIDPKREGDVAVRLEFTGGTERRICRLISLLTACALAGAIALQRRS